jgi:hypothetical protein
VSGIWELGKINSLGVVIMKFNLQIKDFNYNEEEIRGKVVWVDPEFQKEQEALGNIVSENSLNNILKTWTKVVEIRGNNLQLGLELEDITDQEEYISKVNKTLEFIESNYEAVLLILATRIQELKNTYWLEDFEKEYKVEDLVGAIGPVISINFERDTQCIVCFDDNDLFLGHTIQMRVNECEIVEVTI